MHPPAGCRPMKAMIVLLSMTFAGWAGWAIGAWASIWLALVLGCAGTAAGLYLARRFNATYLP